jgi:5-methylthioadenosine/S-adenosylhomocysteine deaminase
MKLLLKNVILNGEKKDILIEKDRIKKIGKNLDLRAEEKIDGKGEKAALPGLINCHTHAAMTLFRGYADDFPLKVWLEEKIWPLERKLTEDDAYWGTKLAILEMLKTGTTSFNDMYWSAETELVAAREMGIRAKIGLVLLDFSPIGSKEYVEKIFNCQKDKTREPVTLTISPHSIYTVSKENLIWAKNFAEKNKLLLHIHLSETEKEVKDCLRKHKLRPVEYLDKIGFLSQNCLLVHSIWLSDREIKIIGERKSSVVYCPCSNMKLASGIFPYQKLKGAKVNICLGTDGAASNNNLDLFEEMKFASLLQKVAEKDPTAAPALEICETAAKNGAKALKINAGEIKEGKLADIILIDLNEICLTPGNNLISDLVYSCSGYCVSDVICNGKILMREKKIAGEEEIKREAIKRADNLKKKRRKL